MALVCRSLYNSDTLQGDKDMNDKYELTDQCADQVGCPVAGYQDVNVCVPITIKVFGEVGNAETQCLGKSVVSSGCEVCSGKPGDVCKFTISQKLRVEVPVIFGARAEAGEAFVDCECGGNANGCDSLN